MARSSRFGTSTRNAGTAAVEFAITAPVLVTLALGAADYGAIIGDGASLEAATRAATEYARNSSPCIGSWLTSSSCVTGINSLVSSLQSNDTALASATFTLPNLGNVPVSTSSTQANYCTCTDGYDGTTTGTGGNCSTTITTAVCTARVSADPRVLQYIRITAQMKVSPIVSYYQFTFPGTLNANTTTRLPCASC
jgi:hypothetical protein